MTNVPGSGNIDLFEFDPRRALSNYLVGKLRKEIPGYIEKRTVYRAAKEKDAPTEAIVEGVTTPLRRQITGLVMNPLINPVRKVLPGGTYINNAVRRRVLKPLKPIQDLVDEVIDVVVITPAVSIIENTPLKLPLTAVIGIANYVIVEPLDYVGAKLWELVPDWHDEPKTLLLGTAKWDELVAKNRAARASGVFGAGWDVENDTRSRPGNKIDVMHVWADAQGRELRRAYVPTEMPTPVDPAWAADQWKGGLIYVYDGSDNTFYINDTSPSYSAATARRMVGTSPGCKVVLASQLS